MAKRCFVTTIDNPFDYFTQFDDWFNYDNEKGYGTCSIMARICKTSDELSEEDESIAIEDAAKRVVELSLIPNPKLIYSDVPPSE